MSVRERAIAALVVTGVLLLVSAGAWLERIFGG